jgi:nitrite reductase (NADH) small subunit
VSVPPLIRVCRVDDIPVGEGRVTLAGGRRVAVFRSATGFHALDSACPHRGGPLADGLLADASVTCPLHLRRFDLATGAPIGHDCPAVTAHAVEVRGDAVYVAIARPQPADRPAAVAA